MSYVRDCKGVCVDAKWYADGKCDDSQITGGGDFFCGKSVGYARWH
jgi:hypothetical protein